MNRMLIASGPIRARVSPAALAWLGLGLLAGWAFASPALADRWPHWRGPLATGASPTADPPVRWSESENIRWKVALPGAGSATPVVWHDRIFVLTAMGSGKGDPVPGAASTEPPAGEQGRRGGGGFGIEKPTETHRFVVLCLDRKTGRTVWQKTVSEVVPHEGHHRDHGFASASPVTDGQVLVASFGSRGIYGLDLEGNVKWSKDLGDMQTRNSFGEGSTPALHGESVVVLWDHEGEDFIAALDKNNGQERWRVKRDEPTTWTTPLVVEQAGKPVVIVPATGKTRCYDLATGREVWTAPGLTSNVIPSAVVDQGVVFVMSGHRGSALRAIKLGGSGDLGGSDHLLWSHDRNTPYVPSPVLVGGLLYFLSGNTGLLTCLDTKTGRPHYAAERLEAVRNVYASPVAAKDRVYILSREGVCVVLRQGPKLEVLATNRIDDATDASIALADRDLLIRGKGQLYCIAEP